MAADITALGQEQKQRKSRHPAVNVLLKVLRDPVGGISLVLIGVLVLSAIAAPLISPYDPIVTSRDVFESPGIYHLFGTDDLGRDMFTRVVYGARVSLYVGIFSVLLGTLWGSTIGIVSGFLGGKADLVIQRVVDALLAFPGLVLAMAMVSVLGTNTRNALIAISITVIPFESRVVRGAVLSVKQNVYIEAAKTLGATQMRQMFRHVLPNVVAPILILISSSLGNAILIEAGLSFLGLSTQPPTPSWGLMLSGTGRRFMEQAPWLAFFPGMAISLTVLSFNLLGDVIRDILDPRLRGSR